MMKRLTCLVILICVALYPGFSLAQNNTAGRIYHLQGEVTVLSRDTGKGVRATPFMNLMEKDRVFTGPLSRVAILFADKSLVKLDENSSLVVTSVKPSPGISLGARIKKIAMAMIHSRYKITKGRFWFRSTASMDIETPSANLGIRGTEFSIAVEDSGETRVAMVTGQAMMANAMGSVLVQAGEQGVVRPGEAPVKQILLRPLDAVQWSLFYPTHVSLKDYYFISLNPETLVDMLHQTETALLKDAGSTALRIRKAKILHDLGRLREAENVLATEKGRGASTEAIKALMGWIALKKGRYENALSYFSALDPRMEMAAVGKSLTLLRMGRAAEALNFISRAIDKAGQKPGLLIQSAMLKLHFGMPEGAMADLRAAEKLKPQALAYGLMSNVHLVQNRKAKALETAEKAMALNPFSPTPYVDLAWARQGNFDLDRALESVETALELDPENIRALITYCQLLFGSGYLEKSNRVADTILAIDPDEPLAQTLKGFISLARRETEDAIVSFTRAVKSDTRQSQPHLGLGIAYVRKGEVEKGLEEMLVATLLDPNVALNNSYLGKALYQIKDFKGADKAFQKAKALDPRDPTPYLYSGIMKTDLNEAAQGIRELETSIRLNDNRAVYRSAFLLDQDRAIKNIDLARTYAGLGLNAMATNRAIRSLKDDPNNSSAHLFMAKVLVEENDRTAAAGSEILKALLLQPANQNSFNSLNEYTSFFEQPDISGSPEIQLGNHDAETYIADFWGSWDNLAFRELYQYADTDGYKPNNFDRSWFNETQIKYQLGLNQDILLRFSRNHADRGDHSTDLDAFASTDPDDTVETDLTGYTFGYHLKTSPESDILFVARRDEAESVMTDGPEGETASIIPPFIISRQVDSRLTFDQTYLHAAATHFLRLDDHRLTYGVEYIKGKSRVEEARRDFLSFLFIPIGFVDQPVVRNEIQPRYLSVFFQDAWRVRPELTLEYGLYFESTKDGTTVPIFSSNHFRDEQISPRLGLIYSPDRKNTLRLGYSHYLQSPFITPSQLRPTDIAGFTIGQNALSGSFQKDLSFAWERQIGPLNFFKVDFFRREQDTQIEDVFINGFEKKTTDFFGGGLEWNLVFNEYFGLSPSYTFIRSKERTFEHTFLSNETRWRDDHEFRIKLNFLHPSGFKGNLDTRLIRQKLHGFDREDPSAVMLLDLSLEKELFDKRMSLGIRVENLLDKEFSLIGDDLSVNTPLPSREIRFFLRYNF